MKDIISAPDGSNNFIKIATCAVWLAWDYLKHPSAMLKHQRKTKTFILFRNPFLAQLDLLILLMLVCL